MKTDSTRELAERAGRAPSLTKVRAENEHVKELVKKSAEELSSVITVIKLELSNEDRLLMFESAIEQQEGSRHAAFHDVLTGLPNRALFNDRLEHGFAQAKRMAGPWR